MSFHVTFERITSRNIKHTHSGNPVALFYRESPEYPNFDQLRHREKYQRLRQDVLTATEHEADDTVMIPPAFRELSREEVDAIVKRLQQNTLCKGGREDSNNNEENEPKSDKERKFTEEEMEEVTKRLQRPTATAERRWKQTEAAHPKTPR